MKNSENCRYLVKTTPTLYPVLYKLIFFETLIIFLETAIKPITEIVDFQK